MRQTADRLLTAIGAAILIMAVFIIGPEIETRFFPVYSTFKVDSITSLPGGQSKVTFQYTQYRWCDPMGFAWYVGEPRGAFRQLKVVPEDPEASSKIRPLRPNNSVPYIIDATASQHSGRVYGEIHNRCQPAWSFRTLIYPQRQKPPRSSRAAFSVRDGEC